MKVRFKLETGRISAFYLKQKLRLKLAPLTDGLRMNKTNSPFFITVLANRIKVWMNQSCKDRDEIM